MLAKNWIWSTMNSWKFKWRLMVKRRIKKFHGRSARTRNKKIQLIKLFFTALICSSTRQWSLTSILTRSCSNFNFWGVTTQPRHSRVSTALTSKVQEELSKTLTLHSCLKTRSFRRQRTTPIMSVMGLPRVDFQWFCQTESSSGMLLSSGEFTGRSVCQYLRRLSKRFNWARYQDSLMKHSS